MKTILVIEDEEALNNALKIILELSQFKVSIALTGSKGLELAQNEPFDLILCDINLPDINGFEILKAVRNNANAGKTPFIFLTALSDEKDRIRGITLGVDDYLTKPFTVKELVETIAARLETSTSRHKIV